MQLDPNNLTALVGLGSYYALKMHVKSAVPLLRKAIEIQPGNDTAHAMLAYSLGFMEQSEESLKHGYKAIELAPDDARHYNLLGGIQQQMGNLEESCRLLERAVELDPSIGTAYFLLTDVKKFTQEDRPMIERMESSLNMSLKTQTRDHIHLLLPHQASK